MIDGGRCERNVVIDRSARWKVSGQHAPTPAPYGDFILQEKKRGVGPDQPKERGR